MTNPLSAATVLPAREYAAAADDGCLGRTDEMVQLAGAKFIRHLQSRGKGAAQKTGFEALNGSDIIVTIRYGRTA
jgi:hypothetical protein